MGTRVIEKIKLAIAHKLDSRHPEYCWATLVVWALGYNSTWEVFIYPRTVNFLSCVSSKSYAWCNKPGCVEKCHQNTTQDAQNDRGDDLNDFR
jgi:hypothetical protein